MNGVGSTASTWPPVVAEQRRLLRERPELWPNAVEELLRYDTVLQTDPRVALEDVTIAGKTIRAGQNLTVMLGAANHDPRRFEDPSRIPRPG